MYSATIQRILDSISGYGMPIPVPPERVLQELLYDSIGDTYDFSSVSSPPVNFDYTVPTGKEALIFRSLIKARNATMSLNNFFGESTLTPGLDIQLVSAIGAVAKSYTSQKKIQDADDFGLLAGSDVPVAAAAGDDSTLVRWTHSRAGGPIYLSAGQSFRVVVSNNLSGITHMYWALQGMIFDVNTIQGV